LKDSYIKIKQRNALIKFKKITDQTALVRRALKHAVEYHEIFMYKSAARAWFKFYKERMFSIRAYLLKMKRNKFTMKKKAFKSWINHPKTVKALTKVRAA